MSNTSDIEGDTVDRIAKIESILTAISSIGAEHYIEMLALTALDLTSKLVGNQERLIKAMSEEVA